MRSTAYFRLIFSVCAVAGPVAAADMNSIVVPQSQMTVPGGQLAYPTSSPTTPSHSFANPQRFRIVENLTLKDCEMLARLHAMVIRDRLIGILAIRKGLNPATRNFGRNLIRDYRAADHIFHGIARGSGLQLSDELPDRMKLEILELKGLSPTNFAAVLPKVIANESVDDRQTLAEAYKTVNAYALKRLLKDLDQQNNEHAEVVKTVTSGSAIRYRGAR